MFDTSLSQSAVAGIGLTDTNFPEKLPLTPAQRALWYLYRLHGSSSTYNVPAAFALSGPLNELALQRSAQALVDRHSALRTRFAQHEGAPYQFISPPEKFVLEFIDLPGSVVPHEDSRLSRAMQEFSRTPFDLGRSPLFRMRVYRRSPQSTVLQYVAHHIVVDGWALSILARDLSNLYRAVINENSAGELARPILPDPYANFLREQSLSGERAEGELIDWWRANLAGLEPLALPTDRPRSARPNDAGSRIRVTIDAGLTEQLRKLARRNRVTLYPVLLCALKVLIHRVSDSRDFAVGVAMAGRDRSSLEDIVGHFVNVLPLRTRPTPDLSIDAYLKMVWQAVLDLFDHREVPFDRLVAELEPARASNSNPLYQVGFVLQNTPAKQVNLEGLKASSILCETAGSRFDLTLSLTEVNARLEGYIEFRRDLFDSATIGQWAEQFVHVLHALIAQPQAALSAIDLTGPDGRRALLERGLGLHWQCGDGARLHRDGAGSQAQPEERSVAALAELFACQVRARPEAIAIQHDRRSLSYRALDEASERLAGRLRGLAERTPTQFVAVCLQRSPEWVIALLATVKAGLTYVPLDPDSPALRLRTILADSTCRLMLADRTQAEKAIEAAADLDVQILSLESSVDAPAAPQSHGAATRSAPPQTLAYLMYTSGTTGQPKGVCIEAASIISLVTDTDYVRLQSHDRIAQASNVAFDAATFEVWGALLNGAQLNIIDPQILLSAGQLEQTLRDQQISTMFLTTSLFNQHAYRRPAMFASLDTLIIGGEACDPKAIAKVLQHSPPKRLLNGYGPTETTTFACWHEFTPACVGLVNGAESDFAGHRSPIGRPLASARCHVLMPDRSLAPIGVIGEIHIGGAGLASGYWNDAALSAEKFVADPLFPGERLYRSGDLGRLKADGVLEYMGRADRQVKLRGFRIELGEVESAIQSLPGVIQAAVITHESDSGDRSLRAFVVIDGDKNAADAPVLHLREKLLLRLPNYAMPALIQQVDHLPLTPNGKLDIAKLAAYGQRREPANGSDDKTRQEPHDAAAGTPSANYRTELQNRLCTIWCSILSRDTVGLDDHFADLGGHSLLGLKLLAKIESETGHRLEPASLLLAPTVRAQSALLDPPLTQPAPLDQIRSFTSAMPGSLPRSLIPLRTSGTQAPLILLRGFGDLSFDHRNLLLQFSSEQPVYVLDLASLSSIVHTASSLQELAQRLAARVRTDLPNGPVQVCGHSMTGNLAWELAAAMQGHNPPATAPCQVILLDCYAPGYPPVPSRALRWAIKTRRALRAGPDQLLALYRSRFQRGFRDLLPILPRVLDRFVPAPPSMDDAQSERGWISLARLWRAHKPTYFDGTVSMIRATVRSGEFADLDRDQYAGWRAFAHNDIKVLPIHCRHIEIVHAEQAAVLGELLDQLCQRTCHARRTGQAS